jgi:hypothetical protein
MTRLAMGGKKRIGSVAPANKRGASAVKLRLTPASTFWKQYDPRLPLQELPHILAVWLRSPSPWRLSLTGLYLPQKLAAGGVRPNGGLSRTKEPRGAIMML